MRQWIRSWKNRKIFLHPLRRKISCDSISVTRCWNKKYQFFSKSCLKVTTIVFTQKRNFLYISKKNLPYFCKDIYYEVLQKLANLVAIDGTAIKRLQYYVNKNLQRSGRSTFIGNLCLLQQLTSETNPCMLYIALHNQQHVVKKQRETLRPSNE